MAIFIKLAQLKCICIINEIFMTQNLRFVIYTQVHGNYTDFGQAGSDGSVPSMKKTLLDCSLVLMHVHVGQIDTR